MSVLFMFHIRIYYVTISELLLSLLTEILRPHNPSVLYSVRFVCFLYEKLLYYSNSPQSNFIV